VTGSRTLVIAQERGALRRGAWLGVYGGRSPHLLYRPAIAPKPGVSSWSGSRAWWRIHNSRRS